MAEKSEVTKLLKNFCVMAKIQFDKHVKVVRSDNGTEFAPLRSYFKENEIEFQTSCVDTPQQNGRVERKHRYILNVGRALRFQANLPLTFWGECILTAAYLINRTPTSLLNGKSPYELLHGKPPPYTHLRIFDCLCFARHAPRDKNKFNPRSRKCIFVGYPHRKKGWRVFYLEACEFFVSRDVVFFETKFPYCEPTTTLVASIDNSPSVAAYDDPLTYHSPSPLGLSNSLESRSENIASPQVATTSNRETVLDSNHPQDLVSTSDDRGSPSCVLRCSERSRQPNTRLKDYVCLTARCVDPSASPTIQSLSSGTLYPIANYVTCANFNAKHTHFLAAITIETEPNRFVDSVKDPRWCDAMAKEIAALESNGTWTIEDLPPGKHAIGCKWVYKIKYNSDGTIVRFKARLVILGNNQVEGVDFNETFAPVAKMVFVRTFLAVVVARGWAFHQMDVHNAFLHGDLDEEVYMQLPPGFSISTPGKVCRLRKSLYALRQAPRNWFAKLTGALKSFGFQQSYADYSLFTYERQDVSLHVLIYVDDLIITGNNLATLSKFKDYLSHCFHMKDLGLLKYFLGIEIARGPDGLFLTQRKYTLDILSEVGFLDAKPADFPIEQNHNLSLDNGPLFVDPARYHRLIGRLIYLTITRPELCYVVHILAQFMNSPRDAHWEVALRVLRYLKGHPGQGILLRHDSALHLNAYCYSDWASCPLTRRSLTGYFILLGDSPISWKIKKQPTVSRSSAEAEYRSMAATSCELTWLKSLLCSLGVSHSQPMWLFCNSQVALHIAANPVFHERTKHIEVDYHYARDQIQAGTIVTAHVRSQNQLANIFTKALGCQ
ncbi:UNVERIFIED_CONTAM: Retrovirus-related Pol polyprotein from transposon RE2 [Sesamum latifolium]|uniref:Retrovirus-related Pol polyprotein from transposon RE2 n=1 Tax=Sesamum latifolium TaxID=2727402 RepID=A0AAW2VFK1_9LAMI